MFDKIDRILVEGGREKPVAIKARMKSSGNDILIDVFEPFYGVKHADTRRGRDHVSKYEVYICLSRDGKQIRVIDGLRQKEIVEEVLQEWESHRWQLPVFYSHKHEGVQMRYTTDRFSGRPKVLMFIPPAVYVGDEIRIYDMK